MVILGIDPGATGAAVILKPTGEPLAVCAFSKSPNYIISFLKEHRPNIIKTAVEEVHAIKGAAARATFSFGKNTGWILGVLDTLEIHYKPVPPRVWQAGLEFVPPKTGYAKRKKALAEFARAMFQVAMPQSVADAYLIAEWVRRQA